MIMMGIFVGENVETRVFDFTVEKVNDYVDHHHGK